MNSLNIISLSKLIYAAEILIIDIASEVFEQMFRFKQLHYCNYIYSNVNYSPSESNIQ